MGNNSDKFIRQDGSFDVCEALAHAERLQRRAQNTWLRNQLARLSCKFRRLYKNAATAERT